MDTDAVAAALRTFARVADTHQRPGTQVWGLHLAPTLEGVVFSAGAKGARHLVNEALSGHERLALQRAQHALAPLFDAGARAVSSPTREDGSAPPTHGLVLTKAQGDLALVFTTGPLKHADWLPMPRPTMEASLRALNQAGGPGWAFPDALGGSESSVHAASAAEAIRFLSAFSTPWTCLHGPVEAEAFPAPKRANGHPPIPDPVLANLLDGFAYACSGATQTIAWLDASGTVHAQSAGRPVGDPAQEAKAAFQHLTARAPQFAPSANALGAPPRLVFSSSPQRPAWIGLHAQGNAFSSHNATGSLGMALSTTVAHELDALHATEGPWWIAPNLVAGQLFRSHRIVRAPTAAAALDAFHDLAHRRGGGQKDGSIRGTTPICVHRILAPTDGALSIGTP